MFADSSCSVCLVLWEGDIDKLVLGDSYKLVNVCVRQCQGVLLISLSGAATIRAIGDIVEVDKNLIVSRSQTKEVHVMFRLYIVLLFISHVAYVMVK